MLPTPETLRPILPAIKSEPLNQSLPGGAIEAILDVTRDDFELEENAHEQFARSCPAVIEGNTVAADDDLTSLSWLTEWNSKNAKKENQDQRKTGRKKEGSRKAKWENFLLPGVDGKRFQGYNPADQMHVKPPFSLSCLTFLAIESSPQKMLPVKEIYRWILLNFPYYLTAAPAWKNSIRHNLSQNKCFKKVKIPGLPMDSQKGTCWMVNPMSRYKMLKAIYNLPTDMSFIGMSLCTRLHNEFVDCNGEADRLKAFNGGTGAIPKSDEGYQAILDGLEESTHMGAQLYGAIVNKLHGDEEPIPKRRKITKSRTRRRKSVCTEIIGSSNTCDDHIYGKSSERRSTRSSAAPPAPARARGRPKKSHVPRGPVVLGKRRKMIPQKKIESPASPAKRQVNVDPDDTDVLAGAGALLNLAGARDQPAHDYAEMLAGVDALLGLKRASRTPSPALKTMVDVA